jgi:hypothetical protein
MSDSSPHSSLPKRILLVLAGLVVFTLVFVIAIRITVTGLFKGIASSRATGLDALSSWDTRSMWSGSGQSVEYAHLGSPGESWIARSADLRARSSSFDHSVLALHQIVSAHHGYLEDLRTESRSGYGRALAATVSLPSNEFDAALASLRTLGRIESVSEAGEDSAVKLATAARHLAATQINLSRLQKLQRERRGELRDVVALEKEIAQANEAVAEAVRNHEGLLSTVAQAHIRITLIEDYRAPLQANLAGTFLELRNSLVEGLSAILSSVSLCLEILFEYGLPLFFWLALLFWPLRAAWRRIRRTPAAVAAAP